MIDKMMWNGLQWLVSVLFFSKTGLSARDSSSILETKKYQGFELECPETARQLPDTLARINSLCMKMRALNGQWISAKMKVWHHWQLKNKNRGGHF